MTKKKTIISEALADYKLIQEAAKNNAKEELAKELPDKFNKLYEAKVKESLNESFDDEVEEPLDGNNISDVTIDDLPKKDVDATKFTIDDLEKIFIDADDNDEFQIEPKDDDEIRLSFDEIVDELNTLNGGDDEGTLDTQDVDGEVINDLESDETELNNIDNMTKLGEESLDNNEELNSILAEILDDDDYYGNDDDEIEIQDIDADRALNAALKDKRGRMAASNDLEINEEDGEVDENLIHTHSQKKTVGGEFPRGNDMDKSRYGLQESKKLKAYIQENTKLLKELADGKKLVKKYEDVVKKYRVQLGEMAIFNTNLSNANSILVNEELNLTVEDKVNVINSFKTLKSIDESTQKYAELLNEFKGKKINTSLLEDKLTKTSTQTQQKQINEVVEKVAYKKDEHIDKLKRLMGK